MLISVYWAFLWMLIHRLIKVQSRSVFSINKMTWKNAYEFCESESEQMVYSTNAMNEVVELEHLPWLYSEYNISSITIWTIHKVHNETPTGTRSYENVSYTIEYNLEDLESVLCVYFVYEELKFSGWEVDDCKNKAVEHHVMCNDAVIRGMHKVRQVFRIKTIAFTALTFYDEKVVWTEAKKYCEYTNSSLININNEFFYDINYEDLVELNLTSLISFWGELPNYSSVTDSVVFVDSVCTFGVGDLIVHEFGFKLEPIRYDEFDCANPIHAIVCEKRTEMNRFEEMNNSMIVNEVSLKTISTSSTDECAEQCIILLKYGIYCVGFNYNWTLLECSLIANLEECTCYDFEFSKTGGMSAFLLKDYTVTIGEYKPINETGSTELQTQDNKNTDPMSTDQQASTLRKTATTTIPTSPVEGNVAGRLLTITMGLISAVSCVIMIYKAASMFYQVINMELSPADVKTSQQEVEEQIYDAFTIEMSEEDDETILTEGVTTLNIPPTCHLDIIGITENFVSDKM